MEEYLRSSYDYDPEYVRGEVVERPMPTKKHSKAQKRLLNIFEPVEAAFGAFTIFAVRSRLDHDLIRLPDFSLYLSEPEGEVPAEPPLLVVEILSPDDRLSQLMKKCAEYRRWGVKHVWVADPEDRKLMVHDTGLRLVDEFTIPEFNLTITPAQIFE